MTSVLWYQKTRICPINVSLSMSNHYEKPFHSVVALIFRYSQSRTVLHMLMCGVHYNMLSIYSLLTLQQSLRLTQTALCLYAITLNIYMKIICAHGACVHEWSRKSTSISSKSHRWTVWRFWSLPLFTVVYLLLL